MTNVSVVIGRLTKDPVIKLTKNDSKVVNFTVACPKSYLKNENNEADFIQCAAWNKLAEELETFTKKGSSVCVVGHIQSSCFTNNKGVIVYAQELVAERIQLLDNRYGMQASVEEIPLEEAVPSL
ncbi:MAG: single-stranded DNA-binding protein [Erysipelotrichaceae bacterium]|nr:single-stranded DNA-binding protein [Erysipelotrichaceae bacterium]